MSAIMRDIQYYITPPHRCSYLEDRAARMVFVDPTRRIDTVMLSELSRQGFRRSGDFIYRPECRHCRQCLSSRIPVNRFVHSRSHRRILQKNADLRFDYRPVAEATEAHYALYARYISERHADGDMYPPSREQFDKFLLQGSADAFFLEFWLNDRLIGCATCDQLDDGVSAVYTFFEPAESNRSLGTFAILTQIAWAHQRGLPYVYLGYWVPQAPKMGYKARFLPLEILLEGRWQRLTRALTDAERQELIDTLSRPTTVSDYRRRAAG